MNQIIYNRLLELARQGRATITTYSEIALLIGLSMENEVDRDTMSNILFEIAQHEQTEGRPMLTSLVVHRGGDNNPGEGFFALATDYNKYNGSRDQVDRLQFWVQEVQEVQDFWREH